MKKLTEDHFKLLKSKYPVLSMEELAQILGGDVSWDCLFNCMNYIDPSRTVNEYVALYTASTGLDPSMSGGVPPGSVTSILSLAGLSSTSKDLISNLPGMENIVIFANEDGTGHAVIARGSQRGRLLPKKDQNGKIITDKNGKIIEEVQMAIPYHDPTTGMDDWIAVSEVTNLYQVEKPGGSGSGSGSNYGSQSSSSSSSIPN